MKKITAIIIAAFFTACILPAQDYSDHITESSIGVKLIVLDLHEDVELIAMEDFENIEVKTQLYAKGRVIGMRFNGERTSLNIDAKRVGDTLFVSTPKLFSPTIIGFSSYDETITSQILCNSSVKVLVKNADQLSVKGTFENIRVVKADVFTSSPLHKDDLSQLSLNAKSIVLNKKIGSNTYKMVGLGNVDYDINAHEIYCPINE